MIWNWLTSVIRHDSTRPSTCPESVDIVGSAKCASDDEDKLSRTCAERTNDNGSDTPQLQQSDGASDGFGTAELPNMPPDASHIPNVRPARRRLPDERQSITHKFSVHGHEGYLTVGIFDEDGSPGEIFIKMAKQGSTISGLMDTIGILTSMCLQHGVPLETISNKLTHTRFEPSGFTHNSDIPEASSIIDYIFRWMALTFSDKRDVG